MWIPSGGSQPGAAVPHKAYLAAPRDIFDCPGWRVGRGWAEGAPGIWQLLKSFKVEQPAPLQIII